MKISRIKRVAWGLGCCALVLSCSKKSSSDKAEAAAAETTIRLSGQLAITGEAPSLRLAATSVDDLSIYCVTFTLPPVAGTGDINAEGAFSLTLEAAGVSVGCFVLDPDKEILGTLVFKDPSKKDLNGNSKSADRYALEGGESSLGNITLDLATGKAEVDVSQIVVKAKDTSTALAAAYDFTGSYVFASSGIDAPEGYQNLCTSAERQEAENAGEYDKCSGPAENMPIYLKRISGKAADGSAAFAMSIWASKEVDALCGNKLGFSYAEGIEHGIDFTDSGVGQGAFTWDALLEDGWKDVANARARHSMMKMENVSDFNGYPGTKQYFTQYRTFQCDPGQPCQEGNPIVASGFQFNANTKDSGCRDGNGKAVQLNDWSNMECTNESLSGGLSKNVCSKTEGSVSYTCTHIGGTFLANGDPIPNAMTRYPEDYEIYATGAYCDANNNQVFDGNEWPQYNGNEQSCPNNITLTPGQLCSSINVSTDSGKLAQLRCYAEANGGGHDEENINSCQREVRGNWSAQTPEEFIVGGNGRAKGQFVMELLDYDSANSASLRGEERDFRGIQVGDNWTDCEVMNVFSMSLKKVDDGLDLYGEMIETETNVSLKPACIAEFGAGKTRKFMFKLIKQ